MPAGEGSGPAPQQRGSPAPGTRHQTPGRPTPHAAPPHQRDRRVQPFLPPLGHAAHSAAAVHRHLRRAARGGGGVGVQESVWVLEDLPLIVEAAPSLSSAPLRHTRSLHAPPAAACLGPGLPTHPRSAPAAPRSCRAPPPLSSPPRSAALSAFDWLVVVGGGGGGGGGERRQG